MKKRVLLVNEFHQLSTGYATYFKHILPHLFQCSDIEIAELAVFLSPGHPQKDQWLATTPWKVYLNEPPAEAPLEVHQSYRSDPLNQLGKFRFDEVLLDFKPDFVITIRDPFVDVFIDHSVYRPYFKHIHMPTIDSEPLKQEWIDQYKKADVLLTYSYFGKRVLEQQSGNILKVSAVASPGAETDSFKPLDKKELRKRFGIDEDAFIIQTVMRNQPRKLFPELFKAFAEFLYKCEVEGNYDLAARSYLHIHTTYPDLGWNLSSEIRNHKLGHKILWTYMCSSCKRHELNFFRDSATVCHACRASAYHLPNTAIGLTRDQLCEIMNIPDVYIQYASCEGWGLPISDAKSCGIPTIVTDYSALSEQGHAPGGIPIEPELFGQEPYTTSTGQTRVVKINHKQLIDKLYELATTEDLCQEIGKAGRKLMEDVYDWKKVSKIWESVIRETPILERTNTWFGPPRIISGQIEMNPKSNNQEFVRDCFSKILQQNPDQHAAEIARLVGLLNQGFEQGRDMHGREFKATFNRQILLQRFVEELKKRNQADEKRLISVFGYVQNNGIQIIRL